MATINGADFGESESYCSFVRCFNATSQTALGFYQKMTYLRKLTGMLYMFLVGTLSAGPNMFAYKQTGAIL